MIDAKSRDRRSHHPSRCAHRCAASRGRYLIRRRPLYRGARGAVSFVSVLDRPTFFVHPLAHLLSCLGARLLNVVRRGCG